MTLTLPSGGGNLRVLLRGALHPLRVRGARGSQGRAPAQAAGAGGGGAGRAPAARVLACAHLPSSEATRAIFSLRNSSSLS